MSGNGAAVPPWRASAPAFHKGVPAWGVPSGKLGAVDAAQWNPDSDWAFSGADGSGVRVCVIDSGVDGTHPLVGTVDQSVMLSESEGSVTIVPVPAQDPAGHGTACASIIRRIAPGCTISSLKVFSSGIRGSGTSLLAGLRWAVSEDFDVINLSLSTAKTRYREDLATICDNAYFRRCVICAAAHNSPVRSFPWQFPTVISVASHDMSDDRRDHGWEPQHFYHVSPPVEFLAPGVNVKIAWAGGKTMRATGNSFASPYIAGICALALSKHPNLTPFELKTILYMSAQNVRSGR